MDNFEEYKNRKNYDCIDIINKQNDLSKLPYNENPYIIVPGFKFNMAIGDTKPDLIFFVYKLGEQFGDPIPLPNLKVYNIVVKIYDYNSNLITFNKINKFDQNSGQINYCFNSLDFIQSGIYFFEVEFTDKNGSTFTLPESNIKNEIIVRN